jgi:hypothetical protein
MIDQNGNLVQDTFYDWIPYSQMSNASSEPFAGSAWTTSSYSTNEAFTDISRFPGLLPSNPDVLGIAEGHTGVSARPVCRSRACHFDSADSIIVMSGAPPKSSLTSSLRRQPVAIGRFR